MIAPDRWHQITEIFHAAVMQRLDDRGAFLDEACAGNITLRRDVESLLQGHDEAASFGDVPVTVPEARLAEGVTLGPYRVEQLIDAGGMGEVYRATDTKLGREVALKVLPAVVASHPERLARFTREAKLLAALNHPHIAAIYGVEDTGDVHALVLELVEGQTLAGSLSRSQLSIVEVLRIAAQIANALAFAHARGIVHRDLKPANVMLTPSGNVKVLDFGLAKASASILPQPSSRRSPSETGDGIIVGTPAYMSPEQARGKPVDKQTDIWAFGCVLYEMLTGARAFGGDTSSDTIASVLEREPNWALLPTNVPAAITTLLKRCLKKDPEERLHDMADAKLEIADALSPRADSPPTVSSRKGWIAAGVVAAVVALALVGLLLPKREPPAASRSLLELTINLFDMSPGYGFEISPDGRRIAMGVLSHGRAHIWLQALDGSDSKSIATADFGVAPFWSPDSQSLAYISGGRLWRLGLADESVTALCDAPGRGAGSWNQQGQIIFAAAGVIYTVPAAGGSPQRVDVADPSAQTGFRRSPQFLPDNRHFIYHVRSATEAAVYLGSLDSPRVTHLVDTPFAAKYVAPGYLLFIRGTALMAQRFETSALTLSGEASLVAQDVAPGYQTSMLQFAASPDGILAYIPSRAGIQGQLTWFERNGQATGHIAAPPRVEYLNPAISPSGDRVAVNRMDPETGNLDVWTIAVSNNLATRQTNDPSADTDPVWAPDGQSFVFTSYRDKTQSLYRKSLDSTLEERLMSFDASAFNVKATDWTRDGRFVIYELSDQQLQELEIWALPLSGDRKPFPLVRNGMTNYGAHVSPDGRWLAYSSYEDGVFAVYVQRFPGGGARTRVTPDGGVHPRWTSDGKTIVYWAEPSGISAVDLTFSSAGVRGSPPRSIITEPIATLLDGRSHYDMTRDGQRILLRQSAGLAPPIVKVLVNWTDKLKR